MASVAVEVSVEAGIEVFGAIEGAEAVGFATELATAAATDASLGALEITAEELPEVVELIGDEMEGAESATASIANEASVDELAGEGETLEGDRTAFQRLVDNLPRNWRPRIPGLDDALHTIATKFRVVFYAQLVDHVSGLVAQAGDDDRGGLLTRFEQGLLADAGDGTARKVVEALVDSYNFVNSAVGIVLLPDRGILNFLAIAGFMAYTRDPLLPVHQVAKFFTTDPFQDVLEPTDLGMLVTGPVSVNRVTGLLQNVSMAADLYESDIYLGTKPATQLPNAGQTMTMIGRLLPGTVFPSSAQYSVPARQRFAVIVQVYDWQTSQLLGDEKGNGVLQLQPDGTGDDAATFIVNDAGHVQARFLMLQQLTKPALFSISTMIEVHQGANDTVYLPLTVHQLLV